MFKKLTLDYGDLDGMELINYVKLDDVKELKIEEMQKRYEMYLELSKEFGDNEEDMI